MKIILFKKINILFKLCANIHLYKKQGFNMKNNLIYFKDSTTEKVIEQHFKKLNEEYDKIDSYYSSGADRQLDYFIQNIDDMNLNFTTEKQKNNIKNLLKKERKLNIQQSLSFDRKAIASFFALLDYLERNKNKYKTFIHFELNGTLFSGQFKGDFAKELNYLDDFNIIFLTKHISELQKEDSFNWDFQDNFILTINEIKKTFLGDLEVSVFDEVLKEYLSHKP